MVRESGRMGFRHLVVLAGSLRQEIRQKLSGVYVSEMRTLSEVIRLILGDYQRHF